MRTVRLDHLMFQSAFRYSVSDCCRRLHSDGMSRVESLSQHCRRQRAVGFSQASRSSALLHLDTSRYRRRHRAAEFLHHTRRSCPDSVARLAQRDKLPSTPARLGNGACC